MHSKDTKLKAYVGTYTTGAGKGIYSFQLDLNSGLINNVKLEAELDNPTYLNIDKENKYLYSTIKKDKAGGVAAFSINPATKALELLNYEVSEGSSPCYVSIDSKSIYAFSANYHKGVCEVYPIKEDGSIKPVLSMAVHKGSGPNKDRQENAHIHYAALTPDDKYLCVIDLGIDKMITYTLDKGILSKYSDLTLKPGCGPRHMDFHPNGKYSYIVTELSSEILALEYDSSNGSFKEIQHISTLPPNYIGENLGSAIHISLDGKYLYTSNRGHDSIATFSIASSSGKLTLVSHTSTKGIHPRDFNMDPSGKFLVVANKDTNNIVPFLIDKATGRLTEINSDVSIPNPVCIKFLRR